MLQLASPLDTGKRGGWHKRQHMQAWSHNRSKMLRHAMEGTDLGLKIPILVLEKHPLGPLRSCG